MEKREYYKFFESHAQIVQTKLELINTIREYLKKVVSMAGEKGRMIFSDQECKAKFRYFVKKIPVRGVGLNESGDLVAITDGEDIPDTQRRWVEETYLVLEKWVNWELEDKFREMQEKFM